MKLRKETRWRIDVFTMTVFFGVRNLFFAEMTINSDITEH
jgi:hypothetical protein